MNILEKLFGGVSRVKIMRLFLFNPEAVFDVSDVVLRSKVSSKEAKKEIAALRDIGIIRSRKFTKMMPAKGKNQKPKRKKGTGWILDTNFIYINELRQFVLNTNLVKNSEVVKRLQKSGSMKLIVLSGLFIQNSDSRLDLFVVADKIKRASLENAVRTLESEIGKELRYVSFDTKEFFYRLSMYDKLVRDVLDFPHEKILNRLSF